jgi:hypothetical protein
MSNSHQPADPTTAHGAAAGGGGTTAPAAGSRPGRHLITMLLLAAAALDLTRCGLILATTRHPGPATGLITAGLAAAALTLQTARGYQHRRPWPAWAALLIGAASAPQAAATGFHPPYTAPDTATAALGILLTIAVLATAGHTGQPGPSTGTSCSIEQASPPMRFAAAAASRKAAK